jgi:hypothetical protein
VSQPEEDPVSDRQLQRWGRASGAIAGALAIAALVVAGTPPAADATGAEVAEAFASNDRLLAAVVIASISLVFLLWFAGAVAAALRDVGMRGWALTIVAALTARAGVQVIIVTLYGSLVWKIARDGDPEVVLAFRDLILALGVTASLPIAVVMFASAMGLTRGGLAPAWYRWLFLAGAAIALAGGTVWAQDGVWAPDGLVGMLSIAVSLLWMFVTSGVLLRAPEPTEAAPERSQETVLYSAAQPRPR